MFIAHHSLSITHHPSHSFVTFRINQQLRLVLSKTVNIISHPTILPEKRFSRDLLPQQPHPYDKNNVNYARSAHLQPELSQLLQKLFNELRRTNGPVTSSPKIIELVLGEIGVQQEVDESFKKFEALCGQAGLEIVVEQLFAGVGNLQGGKEAPPTSSIQRDFFLVCRRKDSWWFHH
ncbi:hypothetical protein MBANPS3_012148 [Mucor bainieri]